MYNIRKTDKFEKRFNKLPLNIRKKFVKQIHFLVNDFNHPSLHTKKKQGSDEWEARVDYHYRFTFLVEGNILVMLSIGMHDEGLKN